MLNGLLRRNLAWWIMGQKQVVVFWIKSSINAADDPSRFVKLRLPSALYAVGSSETSE